MADSRSFAFVFDEHVSEQRGPGSSRNAVELRCVVFKCPLRDAISELKGGFDWIFRMSDSFPPILRRTPKIGTCGLSCDGIRACVQRLVASGSVCRRQFAEEGERFFGR